VAVYWSPYALAALTIIAGAIGAAEWSRLCGAGSEPETGVQIAATVIPTAVVPAALAVGDVAIASSVALGMLFVGAAFAARMATRARAWSAAGVIAVGLPCLALTWMRIDAGGHAVMWLFGAVWATDVGAYFAGRTIGGPRLASRISPNKTWAGLAGGIVCAALWTILFAEWRQDVPALAFAVLLGAMAAAIGQIGDLGISVVKRRFGHKDTGTLIPGHGGVLDRVDGLLTTAPALALLLLLASEDMPRPW
jgi:phosphatidate cytidylyltransferase